MAHLKLPEWRELSRDEQIPIINLPIDRSYFVQGGPGTGKSILAIHRIARIKDLDPDRITRILVYNKPLQLHLHDALMAAGLDGKAAQTCHKWIGNLTGLPLPSTLWGYNWTMVREAVLRRAGGSKLFGHLIIDEAQDIPVQLLRILNEVAETVTLLADGKQAINPEANAEADVSIEEMIPRCFQLGLNSIFYLSLNFRNTQPILDAAHSIKPPRSNEISDRAVRQDGPKPILRKASVQDFVQRVETYHANNPADRIGVAVPRQRDFEIYKQLKNSEVPVQIYRNRHVYDGSYSACAKGVTILTYEVMKGLEFDAVFLPLLNEAYLHRESTEKELETSRNLFYVASTRARSFLEFSYENELPDSWLTQALTSACQAGHIRRA